MPHDQIYHPDTGEIGPLIRYYGCTRCQRHHYEDEEIFEEHLMWQSKHGTKQMHVELRIRLLLRKDQS